MKQLLLLLISLTILVFSSCKKDTDEPIIPDPTPTETGTETLIVPSDFEWNTVNNVTFTLTGFANGYVTMSSTDEIIYLKANIKKNESVTITQAFPTYESTIILEHLGKTIEVDITSGNVVHQFSL